MKYIDLSEIRIEELLGKWSIEARFNKDYTSIFYNSTELTLKNKVFESVDGKTVMGRWKIFKEEGIIYNPQILFEVDSGKSEVALITRLYDSEGTKPVRKLTLYFDGGMELVLKQEKEDPE